MAQVSIPQGTRDFSAAVVRKRNYIFSTIKQKFELFGFQPLETPAMEKMETLLGKYGDEGDQLIFKILNNGLSDSRKAEGTRQALENVLAGKNDSTLTERALRYDLTIPFARHVAMNHNQLTFPFKRYQIQPVWRADRPQKGRYREFFQCDADIVGTNSPWCERELLSLYEQVFAALNLPVTIKINNRKIFNALADICGGPEYLTPITTAVDKVEKIGVEKVMAELESKGLSATACLQVKSFLSIQGENEEKIVALEKLFAGHPIGQEGLAELRLLLSHSSAVLDTSLARGLDYYTGTIVEVKANNVVMGSIGGGGRYDNLTGTFGVPGIAGVGISFGIDRIYDVLEESNLFPEGLTKNTAVLFLNMGEQAAEVAFKHLQALRNAGIPSELMYENLKLDKQFKYAEKKSIPFAAIIGEKEIEQNICKIKNLTSGEQVEIALDNLVDFPFLEK